MPAPCFHWHQDARAFAGAQQVGLPSGPPVANIPADPVADALQRLHQTLGKRAFCVSGTKITGLDQIDPTRFATLTGGTSGQPKIILRSQASWTHSFDTNAAAFNYGAGDSIAVLGALSHSLALYGTLEAVHLGLNIHVLAPLKPTSQSAQLSHHRCTILYATPTQLRLLPAKTKLPHLRLILCGGGALPDAVRAHIATLAPNAAVHEFYGAAETSFVTLSDASTPAGSVGRPYPRVEIDVRTPDSTGTGLIWVRSPYLFDGYLEGDSPHTQRVGDWITVGEYGMLDAQGYLHLRGRAGRMINIADTAVFPEELEAHIATLPHMPSCAILARLDAMRGRHLIAVLGGPENAHLRTNLLHHCKERGLTVPRAVEFLDPFPLLPSGKPDLQRIAALTGSVL